MKKIYYIFSLVMLLLCIACEKSEFEEYPEGLYKADEIEKLLNDYELLSVTANRAEIISKENAETYKRFENEANYGRYLGDYYYYGISRDSTKIRLLVKEATQAPKDVKAFFQNNAQYIVGYVKETDNHIHFSISNLKPNTTYYCVGNFFDGLADTYGNKPISFTTPAQTPDKPSDQSPTPIDIGLSVKWANMNLGATNPTEKGNAYQLSNVEKNIAANPLYDKAIIEWGQPWRMPTKTEAEELLNECTWTFTSKNGVEGYKVTGPNGQSLFFPCINDTKIYLWTGTCYYDGKFYYFEIYLNNDDRVASLIVKKMFYGFDGYYFNNKYIRPVQAK